jgi:long-chain acyl-CoA synthetase
MVSHKNASVVLQSIDQMHRIESGSNLSLLILPLSHFYPRVSGYYYNLYKNIPLAIAESMDTIGDDLVKTRPTYFCCVPRILEKVHTGILNTVEKGSVIKKAVFRFAVDAGRKKYRRLADGGSLSPGLILRQGLADVMVFSPT